MDAWNARMSKALAPVRKTAPPARPLERANFFLSSSIALAARSVAIPSTRVGGRATPPLPRPPRRPLSSHAPPLDTLRPTPPPTPPRLSQVALTKTVNDEFVRFGDVVQIANLAHGAVLAVDVASTDLAPRASCVVSGAFEPKARAPCAGNTFTFEKYHPRSTAVLVPTYDDGSALRPEGEDCANPAAGCVGGGGVIDEDENAPAAKMRLKSFPVSTTHFARLSRECEVVCSAIDSYECVFEVLTPDPARRLASEGVEVMAGAPVVLLHCQTNRCAAMEGAAFATDFGNELEVCGRTVTGAGNAYVMQGLATGKPQSMSAKAPGDVNVFTIVTGETTS